MLYIWPRKYQKFVKNVWMLDEVPTKVKTFLNLPDKDEGIDLIKPEYVYKKIKKFI